MWSEYTKPTLMHILSVWLGCLKKQKTLFATHIISFFAHFQWAQGIKAGKLIFELTYIDLTYFLSNGYKNRCNQTKADDSAVDSHQEFTSGGVSFLMLHTLTNTNTLLLII